MNKTRRYSIFALVFLLLLLTACYSQPAPPPDLQSSVRSETSFSSPLLAKDPLVDTETSRRKEFADPNQSVPESTTTHSHEGTGKTAYLTFDDGPSANTEPILAILRRYSIHATFFVIGNQTMEGQRLYRRIQEEGHVIGNHTFSHDYASLYSSVKAFAQDTERLSKLLEQVTGKRPELLRFPGGSNNHVSRHYGGSTIMKSITREMTSEGYEYTDWNVSSTDAALPVQAKDEIIGAVLSASKAKREVIVLMHDVSAKTTTVEALPDVIEGLLKQGYHFATLGKGMFTFRFLKP